MNVANDVVRVGAALWRSWPECMQGLSSRLSLPLCFRKALGPVDATVSAE